MPSSLTLEPIRKADAAVAKRVPREPVRAARVRLLLLAFVGVFALAALMCVVLTEWGFAAFYAVVAGLAGALVARFLGVTQAASRGSRTTMSRESGPPA